MVPDLGRVGEKNIGYLLVNLLVSTGEKNPFPESIPCLQSSKIREPDKLTLIKRERTKQARHHMGRVAGQVS